MTQNRRDRTRVRPRRKVALIGLAALTLTVTGQGTADAATLPSQILRHINNYYRQHNPIEVSGSDVTALQTFLAKGPAFWAKNTPPKFPEGLILSYPNGALRPTQVVAYLAWKRAQDPILFDWRHPRIAPLFQQYTQTSTQAQAQVVARTIGQASHSAGFQVLLPPPGASAGTPTVGTGSPASGTPHTSPEILVSPAPVPEPASVVSTLLLFGAAGGWWNRRRVSA
jgi:hypothetical protein